MRFRKQVRPSTPAAVIQTRRVEVLDGAGNVRIVLGYIGQGTGDIFGVSVRDENGRDRAWLTSDGPASEVGLDHAGNTVAALSVDDAGFPRLFLEDGSGD